MPTLDDNDIEDLVSSTDPVLDEQPANKQADPAKSSDATGETDDDLLSVVRDVVKEGRQPEAASPTAGEEAEGQPDAAPKKLDDDSNVPFSAHPRWRQVVREKNENKADAESYRTVQRFLDDAGMDGEEAAQTLTIAALAKTNPAEAWKQVQPWLQKLVVAAGVVPSPELQARVQAGELSPDAARELSQAQARAVSVEASRTFEQQRNADRAARDHDASLTGAANAWIANRVEKDPNFEAKSPLVHKEVLWLQSTEGKPNTPEGVKAQLAKAYKAVNDAMPQVQPKPVPKPAIRPVTGGQVAGNPRSANLSTLDIVRANRRAQ
jgi:hypothetical protein